MRTPSLLCFSILLLISCDNSKKSVRQVSFQSFDFTYNDVFSTCFSIRFLPSDTAFIRQHFARTLSDSLKSETSYYAILSKSDKAELDSFINALSFSQYDSVYYQAYQDGIDYQFYIEKDTIKKLIRVHSDSVPLALADFKNWIVQKKKQLQLHQVDTTIHFKSEKYVVPPPSPPPPPIDLKVPKTKNSR
jgi:hypothetical protein